MKVIRNNQRLSKTALQGLALLGWVAVLYLCYVVGRDSWERTMFSVAALTEGLPDLDPFNKRYADHLGGVNRVTGGDLATVERIPSAGRFAYTSVTWEF